MMGLNCPQNMIMVQTQAKTVGIGGVAPGGFAGISARCVGKKCAAYRFIPETDDHYSVHWCGIASDPPQVQLFIQEQIGKTAGLRK